MNILVIGNGGREHALVWKLSQSPSVEKLYCAPGNAGTSTQAENVPIDAMNTAKLLAFAKQHAVDVTVVGPEAPLAAGLADAFRAEGLAVFGPSAAAAKLESSKAFAKEFMKKYRIPTAAFQTFGTGQSEEALRFLERLSPPYVLKADGLAAGKGVVIADTVLDAEAAVRDILVDNKFGEAGSTLVIEEYMHGVEASVFAITDGTRFATLAPAQDHKRILDNDMGLNTGGMGAFAPTPYVGTELLAEVKIRIIKPVIDGMKAEGAPYVGVLYVGLMLTDEGAKVLEFNCRFGDPETQVVLPLIDGDLGRILHDAATGAMDYSRIPQHDANAVCVVMASNGYPGSYETGKPIAGIEDIDPITDGVLVFHAGTKSEGGKILTAGGRVLGVTALGEGKDFAQSIRRAYNAVSRIRFDGAYYRTDIAKKALATG